MKIYFLIKFVTILFKMETVGYFIRAYDLTRDVSFQDIPMKNCREYGYLSLCTTHFLTSEKKKVLITHGIHESRNIIRSSDDIIEDIMDDDVMEVLFME